MFWGLIMEPNKRYTQTVEKSFHVSMASLDAVTADNAIVQVMLCYDERNYLLCSLKKDLAWQVPLDLNFQEGTKIAFTSNGRGHVHLTGYLIPEEEDDLDLDELEEEEEEEEDNEEAVPQLVGKQPKRKANESPKENKKIKRLKALMKQEESSGEEDDDVEKDDDEEEESVEAEVEGEDDSDEVDEDDDDEEEEDDSEEEEEEEVEVKPQQKKNKQQQQQQQQQKQNAKQEKQKMVNGKDSKQEPQKQQKKNKAEQQQQQQQQNNAQVQKKKIVEGGVQVEDIKVGNGAPAKSGKFISVYYVGRLKNGKKFDSTQQGEGFKFRLGKGEVIKGWDVGIAGMKVGGKRRITIPPPFAYGAKGSPPTIPGNSTLVFEVELKNVH